MIRRVPAKIFVPRVSSEAKVRRIRSYGADLVISGDTYADALGASQEHARASGALEVHAFDQVETISGQGTLAREFESQAPAVDTVLVAVGGGGLIAGIAAWYDRRVRIIGVEPELAPTLTRAIEAGEPVDAPAGGLAVDSLAPRRIGSRVFAILRNRISHALLVPDDAIRQSQASLWEWFRIVAEPGGAAAFAALLCGAYTPQPDEHVGVIVSGGNTTAVDFDA
jgi:threonine dehydratase